VAQSPNQLLACLPPEIFSALAPHLQTVKLVYGHVLADAGGEVRHAYFPHSGVISLVVQLAVGEMIETAMVGRDGVMNASSALDGRVSFNKGVVQMAGGAFAIEVDRLRAVARTFEPFRALLIRHDQILFAQSQQSAACNASHAVEPRMCRWLLRMRDLGDGDDLVLTQEFLAQMLGVTRPSVLIVADTLQQAGLIRYSRDKIQLLDIDGLREGSCECYATVKSHYDRLLAG
jgi:CRP-like cAMP-binding protein